MPRPLLRSLVALAAVVSCAALPARALTLVTEENAPINYTDAGRPAGMSTEVVLEMARRAGIPVQVESLPWDKAFQRGQADRDTCLYSVARLENRENLFAWVGQIGVNRWAVFGKSDFSRRIRALADLRPLKIGGVYADAKVEFLKANAVTNIKEVRRDEQNPPRLFLQPEDPDRIDLWVTGYYAAPRVASVAKAGAVKLVYVLHEEPLWLACSPLTGKDTVRKLTDALVSMRNDGSVKRIFDAYESKATR